MLRIVESSRATADNRVLVTFDRDFGELVFRGGMSGHPGMIFLRFVPVAPWEAGALVAALIASAGLVFDGYFTVVERDHVRQRRLP